MGVTRASVPRWMRDEVYARSGGACEACVSADCRGESIRLHHVVEVKDGGRNEERNLLAVCEE